MIEILDKYNSISKCLQSVLNQTLADISKCIQWQTNWIFVSQTKWNILATLWARWKRCYFTLELQMLVVTCVSVQVQAKTTVRISNLYALLHPKSVLVYVYTIYRYIYILNCRAQSEQLTGKPPEIFEPMRELFKLFIFNAVNSLQSSGYLLFLLLMSWHDLLHSQNTAPLAY